MGEARLSFLAKSALVFLEQLVAIIPDIDQTTRSGRRSTHVSRRKKKPVRASSKKAGTDVL
jgi:hypothetical protein